MINEGVGVIKNVAVIGLGKLGASMAGCLASRGFEVVGVDVSPKAVDALNAGHAPAQETGLDELIGQNKGRIRATLNHEDAVLHSDLSFVIVPTPSDERGAFSLQYVAYAFEAIGKALRRDSVYCLFSRNFQEKNAARILASVIVRSSSRSERSFGIF
jgi:UDPglucose 6-dehydrogenase